MKNNEARPTLKPAVSGEDLREYYGPGEWDKAKEKGLVGSQKPTETSEPSQKYEPLMKWRS